MRLLRTLSLCFAISLAATSALAAQGPPARPRPARMPHRTLGKDDCLSCHARGANAHVTPVPEQHAYANAACQSCHRPAETMPSRSDHAFDAMHTRCAVCHVAGSPTGAQAIPADHTGRDAATCVMCHEPKAGS